MIAAQHVFDLAMSLMDELSISEGLTVHADTRDFRRRTPAILTVLTSELYKYSDTYDGTDPGVRPVLPVVEDMSQKIELDAFLARTVLPYGLAAHLLAEESPSFAAFFMQRYQSLIINHGSAIPTITKNITNLYGRLNPSHMGGR